MNKTNAVLIGTCLLSLTACMSEQDRTTLNQTHELALQAKNQAAMAAQNAAKAREDAAAAQQSAKQAAKDAQTASQKADRIFRQGQNK